MRSVSGTPRYTPPPPISTKAAAQATHLLPEYGQHSSEIFRESATDELGFHLARLNRSGTSFSLARILSDRKANGVAYANAHQSASIISHQPTEGSDGHSNDKDGAFGREGSAAGHLDPEDWDDASNSATEVQSCLTLVDDQNTSRWWHASISSFAASNERSYFFAVLLVSPQTAPERPPVILPENVSPTEPLTRPMLSRKKSEPVKGPSTIEDCVDEGTLNRSIPAEFYKVALESMPQILFTSAKDGVVTYLNTQWYDFTGWDPKLPNSELWADVFHPADVQQAVEMYGNSVRTGQDIHLNYRVKNKHGQFRWMIARGRPIRDDTGSVTSFVSTLTDGQDLINARQEAVQARHYVSTVLRAAAIALIVVDPARRVTIFEGHVSSTLGLGDRNETAGKLFDATVWGDPLLVAQVREMLDQYARTNALPSERDFQSTVGACNFRYRLTPLCEITQEDHDLTNMQSGAGSDTVRTMGTGGVVGTGGFSGIAIVCTDVTAMKQAQVALQQSQIEREALVASETAAKEASRMKSVFVSSLSHEIRTPISGMLGISELLLADASLGERQRSLVSKQLQAGELLLQLVSMVLDIGKMEANKLEIERTPFLLTDLLRDMDIFGSMAEAKLLYFSREATGAYAGPLLGDRLRLAQVLSNFVSNAVKFTTTGGVTLSVSHEDHGEAIMLDCKIVDTGIGIDSETLPQLFQPFHQASVSTARHYGGSGLGLTIAKQLIELMGGTVSLQSALGVGSSVHVRIPLDKVPLVDPVLSVPDQVAKGGKAQIARDRCSILIAEDNALLQEVYAALLRKMGFTKVTVADDGQHAVDQVDKADFDVILMDVEMPRMNGPAAVAAIRQHQRSSARETKVIALTANSMSGDKERFLALSFDMYLPKPVRASALEAAITECLLSKETRPQ